MQDVCEVLYLKGLVDLVKFIYDEYVNVLRIIAAESNKISGIISV